jgi:hypothetical protein
VNDIEIACLRLRCEEAELELTKVEHQRDVTVALLRDAREHPDYVDGDMKLYMPDVIDDALKALGAEDAK